ncbi:MAG: type II toxin-antitoxin system HicA family toxin [Armatimonadota bacterium]|jgi:predicted RNA binding protein YcfA (HicA-like mRNA interferase family)
MARLPVISGRKLIAARRRAGFVQVRQKGGHVSLERQAPDRTHRTVVPLHRELAKGTLRDIINQAGISKEELLELLR